MKKKLNDLIDVLKTLRSPGGCDWDRAQTHESLIPYLLEETYEVIEQNLINKISKGTYMVDAKISIYDLQEAIDVTFPDDRDYDTLGGFILNQLQEIPQKNDTVEFNTNIFKVISINKNRIGQIQVIRNEKKA
jgi:CBS domain containing-hemolysin-like protein